MTWVALNVNHHIGPCGAAPLYSALCIATTQLHVEFRALSALTVWVIANLLLVFVGRRVGFRGEGPIGKGCLAKFRHMRERFRSTAFSEEARFFYSGGLSQDAAVLSALDGGCGGFSSIFAGKVLSDVYQHHGCREHI